MRKLGRQGHLLILCGGGIARLQGALQEVFKRSLLFPPAVELLFVAGKPSSRAVATWHKRGGVSASSRWHLTRREAITVSVRLISLTSNALILSYSSSVDALPSHCALNS